MKIDIVYYQLEESSNQLVTIDVGGPDSNTGSTAHSSTRLRSIHACNDTVDVALFTDPEEIYLMKVAYYIRLILWSYVND